MIEFERLAASLPQDRPSWEEYFIGVALLVSTRSDCLRRRIGCVAVSPDNRIVATGYNAPPKKELSYYQACILNGTCPDSGCCKGRLPAGSTYDACNAIHAEANCLLQLGANNPFEYVDLYLAGRHGSTGDVLFDLRPCIYCARLIKNANVRRIYTLDRSGVGFIEPDLLKTTI